MEYMQDALKDVFKQDMFVYNGVVYRSITSIPNMQDTDMASIILASKNDTEDKRHFLYCGKQIRDWMPNVSLRGYKVFYAKLDVQWKTYEEAPLSLTTDDATFIITIDVEGYMSTSIASNACWDEHNQSNRVQLYYVLEGIDDLTVDEAKKLPLHTQLYVINEWYHWVDVLWLHTQKIESNPSSRNITAFQIPHANPNIVDILGYEKVVTRYMIKIAMRQWSFLEQDGDIEYHLNYLLNNGYKRHPNAVVYIRSDSYTEYRYLELMSRDEPLNKTHNHCANLEELINSIHYTDAPDTVFMYMADQLEIGYTWGDTKIKWSV